MIVGTPPFAAIDDKGTESFDSLVLNVVRLDYQLPDQLSLEVRQLIDAMLQVPRLLAALEWLHLGGSLAGGGGMVVREGCTRVSRGVRRGCTPWPLLCGGLNQDRLSTASAPAIQLRLNFLPPSRPQASPPTSLPGTYNTNPMNS